MKIRNTARLVVLDEVDRLLMLKIYDPSVLDQKQPKQRPLWVTPGGEIESKETFLETIKRELLEETGIKDAQFGPCIWRGEVELIWKSKRTLLRERFFIARVQNQRVTFDRHTPDEKATIQEYRWFTLKDLEASKEIFLPTQLPHLVKDILQNGPQIPKFP